MSLRIVKSAARTLDVLELFARRREELSARQIESALDIPPSSTIMLLKSLMKLGYLRFDRRTKLYHPTLRVTLLGSWLRTGSNGSDAMLNAIEALVARTRESVFLSTPNDVSMQVTHIAPGPQPISLHVSPGLLVPMIGSAVGQAYLATRSDDDVAALVRRINRALPPAERAELARVRGAVREVRRRGYSIVHGVLPGVGAIARAIPGRGRGAVAVMCIGGPSERIRPVEATLARELRRCTGIYFRSRGVT